MFIGEHTHKVDEKGRLALPVKFRGDLASGAVVTKGLDHSLYLFTSLEWQAYAEKLSAIPSTDKAGRQFQRVMLAGATDVAPDKQGRILLPQHLRAYAGLGMKTTEVVVAGLGKRIEIWAAAAWKEALAHTETETDRIAEHLSELGI